MKPIHVVAFLLSVTAVEAQALTLNPMLQNHMVLQRHDATNSTIINGTVGPNATVTVQFPCDNDEVTCNATAESAEIHDGAWFYDVTTGADDYTPLASVHSVGSSNEGGQRMRITITGDTTNCEKPSGYGYLKSGESYPYIAKASNTSLMNGTDVSGVVDVEENTCTIDLKHVLVGEVWLCAGQSALVTQWMGHSWVLAQHFPAIRASSESGFTWNDDKNGNDDVSSICFWLATELQNKLQAPIGIIQRAVSATPIRRWEGDSICADAEMFNVIHSYTDYNNRCSNSCDEGTRDGQPCLTDPDCPGGTCDLHLDDLPPPYPHQEPTTGAGGSSGWGDWYLKYVYSMWPYSVRGVFWLNGADDKDTSYRYRHELPGLARSWRQDRQNLTAAIGGLPENDLAVIWGQNAPKASGTSPVTQAQPDTIASYPDQGLQASLPEDWVQLQTNELDDPMHATYVTGYLGQSSGGCWMYPGPGGTSACPRNSSVGDGMPVIACPNCYMVNYTDLSAFGFDYEETHPNNSLPYVRTVAQAALTQVYGMTSLQPGFSHAWSGPQLIGMEVSGTTGTTISLCFRPQTAVGLFGMLAPGADADPDYPLHGFACWNQDDGWKEGLAAASGERIVVECPPPHTPRLLRYGKSRFETEGVLWANVFNGDSMALHDFIVDAVDTNVDQCPQ